MEQDVRTEMALRIDNALATGMHALYQQSFDEMLRVRDTRA